MPKLKTLFASTCVATSFLLAPFAINDSRADEATARKVAEYAHGAGLVAGITDLKSIASDQADNAEAQFGLGVLQFLAAIEGLQQDLYRYGAGNQQVTGRRRGLAGILPVFRVPVPPNPDPETVSYEKVRQILAVFVARLTEAEKTLSGVGDAPVKLPINLLKIRLDANGDGKTGVSETLGTILTAIQGRGRTGLVADSLKSDIAFDTADAKWLQAYSNVLMSIGNFFLSFDFRDSYDASFHAIFGNAATAFGKEIESERGDPEAINDLLERIKKVRDEQSAIFPRDVSTKFYALQSKRRAIQRDKKLSADEKNAKLAKTESEYEKGRAAQKKSSKLRQEASRLERELQKIDPNNPSSVSSTAAIMDAVSFLHTLNWPTAEPDRLKAVRANLLKVVQLNRETWRLVRAETDDDREWLPNAKQTSPFVSLKVTDETIDAWLQTVGALEKVLQGELLVPSARFGRGTNMKKFFETAKRFDLVMFITGPGVVPYLQEGPKMDQRMMRALNNPFGRNFNAYAIWFN